MTQKPRTVVLCFDGTGQQYGLQNTNVVKFYSLLRKDKIEDQVCYYQAGIGTYYHPGVVQPIYLKAAKLLDVAVAWYLYEHVMEGYRFLMQNYNGGDKVCIFGFSRGAYTARALAGMLHKVGLLSIDNIEQIPFAYKLYEKSGNESLAQGFKATFCREVPIDFVGVWDTVASVGIVSGHTLPFVDANTTIRVFRQALSLDERRVKFRPNLYHHSVIGQPTPRDGVATAPDKFQSGTDELFRTDVKEVWFAGGHSDVGGGEVPDSVTHNLSNLSLRWMIEQIVDTDCPIVFDWAAFARWDIPLAIAQKKEHTFPSQQDAQDLVQPTHDALKWNPIWWLLEFLPLSYSFQNANDLWETHRSINLGRGRSIPPKPNPSFHESVKLRMSDPKLKYKPRARYTKGTEIYVS